MRCSLHGFTLFSCVLLSRDAARNDGPRERKLLHRLRQPPIMSSGHLIGRQQWTLLLHIILPDVVQKKFSLRTVIMDVKSNFRDQNCFFVPDCKHGYFCCKVGHLNMEMNKVLFCSPSGQSRNCCFCYFLDWLRAEMLAPEFDVHFVRNINRHRLDMDQDKWWPARKPRGSNRSRERRNKKKAEGNTMQPSVPITLVPVRLLDLELHFWRMKYSLWIV